MSGHPPKRTCPSCKETKDLTEEYFNPIEEIPYGFESYCKPCMEVVNLRILEIKNRNNQ